MANLRVFADFDGVLLEPEEGVDSPVEADLDQIQECDPKELEQDVYEEFTLLFCKKCRDEFVEQTRHPWTDPFWSSKGPGPFLH